MKLQLQYVMKYSGIFGTDLFELLISNEDHGATEISFIVVGLVIVIIFTEHFIDDKNHLLNRSWW